MFYKKLNNLHTIQALIEMGVFRYILHQFVYRLGSGFAHERAQSTMTHMVSANRLQNVDIVLIGGNY